MAEVAVDEGKGEEELAILDEEGEDPLPLACEAAGVLLRCACCDDDDDDDEDDAVGLRMSSCTNCR